MTNNELACYCCVAVLRVLLNEGWLLFALLVELLFLFCVGPLHSLHYHDETPIVISRFRGANKMINLHCNFH